MSDRAALRDALAALRQRRRAMGKPQTEAGKALLRALQHTLSFLGGSQAAELGATAAIAAIEAEARAAALAEAIAAVDYGLRGNVVFGPSGDIPPENIMVSRVAVLAVLRALRRMAED